MNEDEKSTIVVKEIPIDIENSYMGKEITCLIECISQNESISAYSDVSFRVLSRIADVLMGPSFDDMQYYQIDEAKETTTELRKFQARFYKKRI